jgi:hypothetical protein
MKRNLVTGAFTALGISIPFAVIFAILGTASSPARLPVNYQLCTHFMPGTVTAYKPAPAGMVKAGTWNVTSGTECQWSFPSESDEDNGTTQTWTNPPITLVTTAGKHVTLPGTDETTFIQNGAHVKAAS